MSSNHPTPIRVDLEIGDQLTSISCGHIVVELIKFMSYQRLQIPYKYQWLKSIVNKKSSDTNSNKESYRSETHFRTVSTALSNLDFILKSLMQEVSGPSMPEEVCIIYGSIPASGKEVYRILLPSTCHKPQCHSKNIASDQKIQQNVFRFWLNSLTCGCLHFQWWTLISVINIMWNICERNLVTNEALSEIFFKPLLPTNMYVFLKKKAKNKENALVNIDNFELTSGCRLPRNSKVVVLDLRTHNLDKVSCCNDFQIFGDITENFVNLEINCNDKDVEEFIEIESTDTMKWYQSTYVMKGFKDCIVNGESITNAWLDS